MENDDVRMALAKAVAHRKVDDDAIASVASRLNYGTKIRGIDPCIYGICLDFVVEDLRLDEILKVATEVGRVGTIRVFPWGIPWPDLFHVQVEQDLEGIPLG